jgi:hypothetical protein
VLKAIAHGELRIVYSLGTIHRLQEEITEVEPGKARRVRSFLRKDQFEFMAGAQHKIGLSLRTDANPIDLAWGQLCAIGFNGDREAEVMEGSHKGVIELEQRLTACAHNEWGSER